jgi:hypothetical protein
MLVRRAGPERSLEAFRVDNPRPIFMVTRAIKAGAAAILAEQSAAHSTRPLIDDTSGRFAGTLWRITTPKRIADTWSWPNPQSAAGASPIPLRPGLGWEDLPAGGSKHAWRRLSSTQPAPVAAPWHA